MKVWMCCDVLVECWNWYDDNDVERKKSTQDAVTTKFPEKGSKDIASVGK